MQVFAVDTEDGTHHEVDGSPRIVNARSGLANEAPFGRFDICNKVVLAGWAWDPDVGTGSIDVEVWIDNELVAQGPANSKRDTLRNSKVTPDPYHGFVTTTPTRLLDGAGPLREGISDTLEGEVSGLRAERAEVRAQAADAQARAEALDRAMGVIAPRTASATLTGVRVAVVVLPGADRNLGEQLTQAVDEAGGHVPLTVTLQPSWQTQQGQQEAVPLLEEIAGDLQLPPLPEGDGPSLPAVLGAAVGLIVVSAFTLQPLLRMLIDQRSPDTAGFVASQCTTMQWYCNLLSGYVASTENHVAVAETFYRRALGEMPDAVACTLGGLGELFEPAARTWYEALACTQRDSVNRVAWWLADPLWIDSSNDRFVEHMTRRVLLELKRGASHDERFDWREEAGSDARAELVMRYGWPAYVHWRGPLSDSVVSTRLRTGEVPYPPNAPYVSYEYGAGRVHVFPSAGALHSPLTAEVTAWSLQSPPGGDTAIRVVLPDTTYDYRSDHYLSRHHNNSLYMHHYRSVTYLRYVEQTLWWPHEHYAASFPIVQLPTPQVAFLRRQQHAIIGTAVRLGALARRDSMIDAITMVVTTSPDAMTFPASTRTHVDSTLRLYASIAAQPALLGIEYAATIDGDPAGRTRFAIAPPPPLTFMGANERAVSDIVLLSPTKQNNHSNNIDSILSRMAPSVEVERTSGVAVYWESYGFKASDSLTIELRVSRLVNGGFTARVQRLFGRSGSGQVGIKWIEDPNSQRQVHSEGPVPIIGRSLNVDFSSLRPGNYRIEVIVRDSQRAVARSTKQIRLR